MVPYDAKANMLGKEPSFTPLTGKDDLRFGAVEVKDDPVFYRSGCCSSGSRPP